MTPKILTIITLGRVFSLVCINSGRVDRFCNMFINLQVNARSISKDSLR